MEVLDVLTFAGKAPVEQWMESSDEEEQRGLYWRQTFNHQTSKISVRFHAILARFSHIH
jgi:hypothetical protein